MRPANFAPCCLLLAALSMPALAQRIDVEFDDGADFSRYKTFLIRPGQIHSKDPSLNNDLVHKRIEAEIRKRLSEKGMEEVTVRPDLNVRWSLGSGTRREVETYPAGWRGVRRVTVRRAEGTLILDLRDPKKQALVWRAIGIEEQRDPLKIRGKLDDVVRKCLDKYPPKTK